jgi:hypothetical protein
MIDLVTVATTGIQLAEVFRIELLISSKCYHRLSQQEIASFNYIGPVLDIPSRFGLNFDSFRHVLPTIR